MPLLEAVVRANAIVDGAVLVHLQIVTRGRHNWPKVIPAVNQEPNHVYTEEKN